ncbi:response regulator transcription factor [Streptomyces microflavus]|uniref:response regulator transcription factor n=1 Tax=Streptomyces microflavus TaxID=1919 RepID=UPI003453A295
MADPQARRMRRREIWVRGRAVREAPSITADPARRTAFSGREREVLSHIAKGFTYAATAHRLGLSPHTVDTYVRRIRAKSGVRNRTELVLLAARMSRSLQPSPPPSSEPPRTPYASRRKRVTSRVPATWDAGTGNS